MSIKLPWRDAPVTNLRSIPNFIMHRARKLGVSFELVAEEVFLLNYPDTNKTCSHCDGEMHFRSFADGYYCYDEGCVRRRTAIACHSHRGKNATEYEKFIRNNVKFYREHQHSRNIIDPFYNKSSQNKTLSGFVGEMLGRSTTTITTSFVCPYCGVNYEECILRNRPLGYCGHKHCRSMRNTYSHEDLCIVHIVVSEFINGVLRNLSPELISAYISEFDFNRVSSSKLFTKILINSLRDRSITDRENVKVIYDNRYNLERLLWVMYPSITFVSSSRRGVPHFKEWAKLDTNLPNPAVFDHPHYFSPCVICNKRNQHRKFFSDKLLSRFCTQECYNVSLQNKSIYHPTTIMSDDAKRIASDRIKAKILDGTFTPPITNSYAKSRVYVTLPTGDTIPCRSSWEATFLLANPTLEYETVRIPYDLNNSMHVYIVDFVDRVNKIIYEIKPISEKVGEKYNAKVAAAINWCTDSGYKYVIIDDDWFINYFKTDQYLVDMQSQLYGPLIMMRMNQFLRERATA